jgi:excisionase family DNA binding protein
VAGEPVTELLTTAEVAERIKRHPKTVERAIRAGRLRATRLSGGDHGPYGVAPEWVDEWINACTTTPAPPMVPPMPATPITVRTGTLRVDDHMGRDREPHAA